MGVTDKTIVAVRCTGITKDFAMNRKDVSALRVLKGIDLEIVSGDVVTIVGASGAGKSTLLHILGGLDRPTGGNVYWKNRDVFSLDDPTLARLRAKEVGFIFQFHHLLQEFTSLENVALAAMIAGNSKAESWRSAQRMLDRVGLTERLHHRPGELSGGEQQRVAVARALVKSPAVVLADEPSGNLDSVNARQLHELILDLNKSDGQTFVLVTHNQVLAEQSRRTYRMADGILRII